MRRSTASLFDHLVGGGEQRRRHVDTKRLGDLEVEYELELDRLHDRQVGRLFASQNSAAVYPKPAGYPSTLTLAA